MDRKEKMPIYAREGVRHAWLIDPVAQTLEVYQLGLSGRWSKPETHRGATRVRVPPFEAIELELAALWTEEAEEATEGEVPARPKAIRGPAVKGKTKR
jgi:Uma2 family endonuclease